MYLISPRPRTIVRTLTLGLVCALPLCLHAQQADSLERQSKAEAYYYLGLTEATNERVDEALDLMLYSHRLHPTDPEIAFSLSRLYADRDKIQLAIAYAEQAQRSVPSDKDYTLFLQRLYLSREQTAEATKLVTQWVDTYGDDADMLGALSRLYFTSGEYDKAIDVFTRLQALPDVSYDTYSRLAQVKAMIYKRINKPDEALRTLEQQLKAFPDEPQAKTQLIEALFEAKRYADALPHLEALSPSRYSPNQIYGLWLEYYIGLPNIAQADKMLERIRTDAELELEQKLALGFRLASAMIGGEGVPQRYDAFFTSLRAEAPQEVAPAMYYSMVLRSRKQLREAISVLDPLREAAGEMPELWESLVDMSIQLEDTELIARYALEAHQHVPSQWSYPLYAAIALHTTGRTEQATALLSSALEAGQITAGHDLSMLSGMLADIYKEMGQISDAHQYYELALKHHEHNANVLNNYAYSLVEEGKDLDKAEWLASRAMKLNGEDKNLLDTYGWIFYKKGNYSLAKLYLRKAINLSADEPSAVYHDHLGDVYMAEGKRDDALQEWRRAEELCIAELKDVAPAEQSERTKKLLTQLKEKIKKSSN